MNEVLARSCSRLDEIARLCPRGFHDAELLRLAHDHERETVEMHLALLPRPASPDDPGPLEHTVRLRFTGVEMCVLDPPGLGAVCGSGSWIGAHAAGHPPTSAIHLPVFDQPDVKLHWFFLTDSNSFLRIAYRGVEGTVLPN